MRGPAVVTCYECGARIRVARPDRARERCCPRCAAPLAASLDAADPAHNTEAAIARSKPPRLWLGAAMALAIVVPPLSVGVRSGTKPAAPPTTTAAIPAPSPVAAPCSAATAECAPAIEPQPEPEDLALRAEPDEAAIGDAPDPDHSSPDPAAYERSPVGPPPPPSPLVAVERLAQQGQDAPAATPSKSAGRQSAPRRSQPDATPPTPAPPPDHDTARRIRVKTRTGEVVVGRVHGHTDDGKTCVILPDGELGFTSGMAETDEPFRPASMQRMRDDLTSSGPFAKFQVRESAHYIVLYQSTPAFAEASIKLLEDLYKNLSEAFRKRKVAVHEPEFPLVAVIFRTEHDFRAHKHVAPDVQAYYEILSNRIYFYQKSDRDQHSPEVAALRKPQTVAHEGTHQILQNIGIHPRLAEWPLWLVEGLAEYCSPPTMTKNGAAWGGLGLVNPQHMATIRDLDDPAAVPVHIANGSRPRLGRDRRMPMIEYLVTRKDLTPTDYALSWALTHYLAKKRGTEFLAFLGTMSQMPPLQKPTPAEQLDAFRAAFGADLVKMDRAVATYLSKLKYAPLPYYAVLFEQSIARGQIRRATLVSQSPSIIMQWLDGVTEPDGGPPAREIIPHPTRASAERTADQWRSQR